VWVNELENKTIMYVSISNMDDISRQADGVTKKVLEQITAFEKMGFKVFYTGREDSKIYIYSGDEKILLMCSSYKYYDDLIQFFYNLKKWVATNKNIDILYMRHYGSNFASVDMLKAFKKQNIINIIEIPTYPYKCEMAKTFKGSILYDMDFVFSKLYFTKYVDLIVNTNGFTNIFGVRSVSIQNSVNTENYVLHKPLAKDDFDIIAVASMQNWHGYDRIIEGMNNYYKKSKNAATICFHLVGEGPELANYKKMCEDYGLQNKIIFHGRTGGKKLDDIFEKCDIAIGSLGIHRIGLKGVSTIKNKEYCARGIPFVFAYNDECFKGDEEFLLKLAADESPADILKIIEFIIKTRRNDVIPQLMRKFATDNLSWIQQYKNVLTN
jgi:glycosyltransferase involved in cell wall biosynthesis